jgi:hypothetical protein
MKTQIAMAVAYTARMGFLARPDAEQRKRSAISLVKYLLDKNRPDALSTHYRELLSTLLWKITEAESHKYKTRFQTQGALDCTDSRLLRHEHVFQRSKMIFALERAAPEEVERILQDAIGCTVTTEEHSLLCNFEALDGWDRYRNAGLVVIDTQTGERVI